MFYYLSRYLGSLYDYPGEGLLDYITVRAALVAVTSLFISMVVGKRFIAFLRKKQIGETIRELGLPDEQKKKGTPTMGGIIILISILLPCLLFCRLGNIYVQLMLFTTIWLGILGFVDDYIKVFRKNKNGVPGWVKLIAQAVLGIVVAITFQANSAIVVVESIDDTNKVELEQLVAVEDEDETIVSIGVKTLKTTIPFYSETNFNYGDLFAFAGKYAEILTWVFFILLTIFVVMATSNGANLTDGVDGLAAGVSSIIGVVLAVLAYVSSHVFFADYLDIMFIPYSQELVIFAAAFVGATIGFLWFNAHPAQIFMGDTGSLTLGGIIGVFSILIHKELLLPILCGVFLIENISVIIQVSSCKITRRIYGEPRRVFIMTPIHHHFQKKGVADPKLVVRFWIVGIAFAVLTLLTLKVR